MPGTIGCAGKFRLHPTFKSLQTMCLAIPGKIISIDDSLDDVFRIAKVSFDGIIKEVNLAMVPEARVGDYVMVHVGSAISIVDEKEARETMDILYKMDEITELSYGNQPPVPPEALRDRPDDETETGEGNQNQV